MILVKNVNIFLFLFFVRNELRMHVWLMFYIKKQAFLGLKNINFT